MEPAVETANERAERRFPAAALRLLSCHDPNYWALDQLELEPSPLPPLRCDSRWSSYDDRDPSSCLREIRAVDAVFAGRAYRWEYKYRQSHCASQSAQQKRVNAWPDQLWYL